MFGCFGHKWTRERAKEGKKCKRCKANLMKPAIVFCQGWHLQGHYLRDAGVMGVGCPSREVDAAIIWGLEDITFHFGWAVSELIVGSMVKKTKEEWKNGKFLQCDPGAFRLR